MKVCGQIILEALDKFSQTPSLTIAKMVTKNNPTVFSSVESARALIKYYRGQSGDKLRQRMTAKPRPSPGKLCPFASLPEGIKHLNDRKPVVISGRAKAAILSDTHLPYHDKPALLEAIRNAKKFGADHIVLNGDIADFFAVSFWEKDPRLRNLANEINVVREFIVTLRKAFPKARIIYKLGNHEERWERFLQVKAPEVLGVADFELTNIFRLDKHGVELVKDCRPIRLGKLNVIHGHEFRWGITSPVNPARGFYQRGKEHCIGGHLHQTSSHSEKSMNDSVVSCWSTGALCDLKPAYAPYNKWNHGYALVESNGKDFEVLNKKIIDGKSYTD